MRKKQKLIIIIGPTASGKSDLAIRLAQQSHGEIVSADSRQVYRGMDIGTGKVTEQEQRHIPHYLLDVADPRRQFSVDRFVRLAKKTIRKIAKQKKLPILCGGTGFYVDALVYSLPIPRIKPNRKLRARLDKLATDALFQKLMKLDPRRAASIDRHNRRRLIRALEIIMTTGKPVPHVHTQYSILSTPYKVLWLGIATPKEQLSKRIQKRLDQRLRQGMIREVQKLHARGISWRRLESFGLEYKWVSLFLQKKISRQQMHDSLLASIIAYSKRQMTWFKRNKNIHWIHSSSEATALVKQFLTEREK